MTKPKRVKIEHAVFALPIALMGASIAATGFPDPARIGRIHLAASAARSDATAGIRPANPAPGVVLLVRERNLAWPWKRAQGRHHLLYHQRLDTFTVTVVLATGIDTLWH